MPRPIRKPPLAAYLIVAILAAGWVNACLALAR